MKRLLGLCALLFSFAVAWQAAADQYVRGYTRSNGTYVQLYHRSYGNGTVQDNYSYRGNANRGVDCLRGIHPGHQRGRGNSQPALPNHPLGRIGLSHTAGATSSPKSAAFTTSPEKTSKHANHS